ncbi:MAG: FG-GAP-like repeat-containing protein [Alphaproteobacteria bacterium]
MATFDLANLGTTGVTFTGISRLDRFGFNVTGPAGDVNGDGLDDLLLAAHMRGGQYEGAAYVVFGNASGLATDLANLGDGGVAIAGYNAARAGREATGIGDVNGDGIADFAIGAEPRDTNNFSADEGPGTTHIIFGRATLGGDIGLDALGGAIGLTIQGTADDDQAYHIAAVGDFNGDGIADVAIGADGYGPSDPNDDFGAVFVIFGDSGGLPASVDLSNLGDTGIRILGPNAGAYAGAQVAGGGDVNGDGIDDIAITTGQANTSSFIAFGSATPTGLDISDFASENGGITIAPGGVDFDQSSIALIDDVNGDGIDDILVGTPFADQGGTDTGAVYLIFGQEGLGNVALSSIDSIGIRINGAADNERAGLVVNGVSDFNGDGFNDILIGTNANKAYIVFGGPALPTSVFPQINLASLSESEGVVLTAPSGVFGIGSAIAAAGDINNDGLADVLAGATGFDSSRGVSYLLYGTFEASATAGDDSFTGGFQGDTIAGGAGNDTLNGGGGGDSLDGGADNDLLIGGGDDSADTIGGGAGNDSAFGQGGDDSMNGGDGDDDMKGNVGDDSLTGAAGADTLRGQVGGDRLVGGDDADMLFGGGGDDSVDGDGGNDVVNGNSGADTVNGGDGDDTVRGQGGNDVVNGNNGNDLVLGISGLDSLFGGTGDDTLTGGVGNDQLTGGDGADVFQFGAMQGSDTITDFADGTDRMSFVGVSAIGELTIVDTDDGAAITLASEGDSPTLRVTLTGITADQLDASDFIFS